MALAAWVVHKCFRHQEHRCMYRYTHIQHTPYTTYAYTHIYINTSLIARYYRFCPEYFTQLRRRKSILKSHNRIAVASIPQLPIDDKPPRFDMVAPQTPTRPPAVTAHALAIGLNMLKVDLLLFSKILNCGLQENELEEHCSGQTFCRLRLNGS